MYAVNTPTPSQSASLLVFLAMKRVLLVAGSSAAFENMNGEYLITPTPKAPAGTFSTKWSEYPGGVESFDVYAGPITTRYSQVWWHPLPEVRLPDALVARFAGKAMAIVGYEVDQVRRTSNTSAGDVSVPISCSYNHHHDAYFTGAGSAMQKVRYDPADPSVGPMERRDPDFLWKPVEHTPSPNGLPTSAHLAAGNGGEYRKSYHGFAAPVAYVIESPVSYHVSPMQIDTWNRDAMNVSAAAPKFAAGPLPRTSLAPTGPDAVYSGLLECPMTDRVQKIVKGGDSFNSTFTPTLFQCAGNVTRCATTIASAEACFAAAARVDGIGKAAVVTSQGASDATASGCTISFNGTAVHAFFNTKETAQCCGAGVASLAGEAQSLVGFGLTVTNTTAQLTLTGPPDVWFGVGLFATTMDDLPYAIIVDGAGAVSERRMGNHAAGTLLPPTISVVSNAVSAGKRTVVLSRPAQGASSQYASFSMQDLEIPFINALGSTSELSVHLNKTAAAITLWPNPAASVCLCETPAAAFGQAIGDIKVSSRVCARARTVSKITF